MMYVKLLALSLAHSRSVVSGSCSVSEFSTEQPPSAVEGEGPQLESASVSPEVKLELESTVRVRLVLCGQI